MAEVPFVQMDQLTHRYGTTVALQGVSLALRPGTIGLVGNNGAGKSTLLKILLGMLRPTQGRVQVFGVPLRRARDQLRRRFGYMAEATAVLPLLKGVEYVALSGQLYGMTRRQAFRRAHEVLGYVGLGELRYRRVDEYSRGNLQRLKLAAALVHDPEVLLLDEPTNGLDPPGREAMLALLHDLIGQGGKSVLLCTHLLGDVERLCRHVVMLDRGRVIYDGPLAPLLQGQQGQWELRWRGPGEPWLAWLRNQGVQVQPSRNNHQAAAVLVLPTDWDTRRLFQSALEHQVVIQSLVPVERNLESVFLQLARSSPAPPRSEELPAQQLAEVADDAD